MAGMIFQDTKLSLAENTERPKGGVLAEEVKHIHI